MHQNYPDLPYPSMEFLEVKDITDFKKEREREKGAGGNNVDISPYSMYLIQASRYPD